MFDWVHNNKKVIQGVLALIFLPFAFFGVDSYFRGGELGAEVARVGDYRVSQQEFQQALRERQEALRRMLNNAPVDQAMLDSPEMRFSALEQLVRERLLLSQAIRSGLTVTDAQLKDVITSQESFREGGKFSHDLYETFLRSQNFTSLSFEARLRRDLLQQPLMDVFGESGFVPKSVVDRVVRLSEQTREASIALIAPAAFVSQVTVEDGAVKAYFDAHAREFEVPEQVRLEYVVLSLDNLAAQIVVPAEEVRQAYDQNPARFATPEERDASHILIQAGPDATPEAKSAARAKAEDLVKQLLAKPDRFADLAREYSQDPGSAKSGGDLGFMARGVTKKAFDDALFSMKEGEIRGPVETEFGFHIIRLKAIRGGSVKPFEEVRSSIEAELKRSRASKRYAELAEQLNNIAYEQSDSLKPAAEALKVTVQQSPWITRKPMPGSPLGSERFLKAAFSEDVLTNKRNSEVVEVAPGTLIAARLLEHKPASSRAFDEVQADIRKRLIEQEALKRALAEGREKLDKLRKGEALDLTWGKPVAVSRLNTQGLNETVLREIFRADATKLPAYAGSEDPKLGYQLIRITSVTEPPQTNAETRKAAAEQLRRLIGQEELADYIAAMKRRVEVKIKPDLIEKK
jgi:peptidyl-prolyl cis-trans isomerase D